MTRTLLGTVLAATLLIGFPGAAGAQSNVHSDPAGDVWSDHYQGTFTPAPSSTDSDIRQVVVQHRKRLVFVAMTTTTIDAQGGPGTDQVRFEFISRGNRRMVMYLTSDNGLTVYRARKNGTLDYWYRCRAARSTADRVSGRRTITFPRKCIGSPRRLRVLASTWSTSYGPQTRYTDDGYGPYGIDGVHRPGSSPWLKRG